METAVLQLLARIKIRLRKEKGVVLNTQRFFDEKAYTRQILDLAEECEDIELVTASLEIRDRLGWFKPGSAAAPAPSRSSTPERPADTGRYVFGARS